MRLRTGWGGCAARSRSGWSPPTRSGRLMRSPSAWSWSPYAPRAGRTSCGCSTSWAGNVARSSATARMMWPSSRRRRSVLPSWGPGRQRRRAAQRRRGVRLRSGRARPAARPDGAVRDAAGVTAMHWRHPRCRRRIPGRPAGAFAVGSPSRLLPGSVRRSAGMGAGGSGRLLRGVMAAQSLGVRQVLIGGSRAPSGGRGGSGSVPGGGGAAQCDRDRGA